MTLPHYIFDAIYDEAYDQWIAVKVYRDGNPIVLDKFSTEDEAEAFLDSLGPKDG